MGIKSRIIHVCLAWAFEYLFKCHKSRRPIVILKLNYEKAFDKVERTFILEVLICLEYVQGNFISIHPHFSIPSQFSH
jgi:hypothetical protein